MFMACGVAAYSAAIFHLMTHAFFKALLFLSAGSVIHALGGEQDMRNMGGLRKLIPWTFAVMSVGTIAIAGIPPLAGFFSKDEILWKAWSSPHGSRIFWAIGIITALMTSFYMFRLLFMTFFGERRRPVAGHGPEPHHGHAHDGVHESPWVMLAPLVLLAVLSIVGGWIWKPAIISGENRFEKFLEPVFTSQTQTTPPHGAGPTASSEETSPVVAESATGVPAHEEAAGHDAATEHTLMFLSVAVGLAGAFFAYLLYVKRPEMPARIAASLGGLYRTVFNKYYVDEAYQAVIVDPLVETSDKVLWRGVDVAVIDGAVNGTGTTAKSFSERVRRMQSGNIRSYAGWVAIGAALLLLYMIWIGVQ
jgi:NADH-quinone oxidoreductase subunit L